VNSIPRNILFLLGVANCKIAIKIYIAVNISWTPTPPSYYSPGGQ